MRVNILVHDGYDLDQLTGHLAESGIPVSQTLKILNTITADVPDQKLAEIRAMDAVKSVEPDRVVRAL
jgi:hypothetical protein